MTDSQFKIDHEAFERRIADGNRRDRESAAVLKAHMDAFERRYREAVKARDEGHIGCARSRLDLAIRDLALGVKALPNGNAIGAATFAPPISL